MARMHARKKGRSGSKKPIIKIDHTWLIYDKDEVIKIIQKLAKDGKTKAQIGILLRDQYGVPDVREFGFKISDIVKTEIPEDLFSLLKKAVNLYNHLQKHKKDMSAKHGFELLESKIRRLVKYYVRKGTLEKGWKYDIERAKLLVK